MATKTRGRKKAKKLRGGTNQPADGVIVPLEQMLDEEEAALDAAEAKLTPEESDEIDKVVDSVVPKPEMNGHVGTVGEAVDQVIERIEEGKPAPDSPASGYTKALADIKGVGPKKVEQWQEAEERFWKRWNANATRPADPAAGGADGKDDAGQPPGDRGAGGDTTAPAEPAPAEVNGQPADADPAGYRAEGSERVANRMRGQQKRGRGKRK